VLVTLAQDARYQSALLGGLPTLALLARNAAGRAEEDSGLLFDVEQADVEVLAQVARALANLASGVGANLSSSFGGAGGAAAAEQVREAVVRSGWLRHLCAWAGPTAVLPPYTTGNITYRETGLLTSPVRVRGEQVHERGEGDWARQRLRMEAARALNNLQDGGSTAVRLGDGVLDLSRARVRDGSTDALSKDEDTDTDAEDPVDVVFMHGVRGDALSTWSTLGPHGQQEQRCWPRQWAIDELEQRLGLESGGVRILSIDYETVFVGDGSAAGAAPKAGGATAVAGMRERGLRLRTQLEQAVIT